jgi:hypothetical protein
MSPRDISGLQRSSTMPFTEYAWKGLPPGHGSWQGLSAETQIQLYSSATPKEKKKYFPMMKPSAKNQVERPQ